MTTPDMEVLILTQPQNNTPSSLWKFLDPRRELGVFH